MLDNNNVSYFINGTNLPLHQRVKLVLENQDAVIIDRLLLPIVTDSSKRNYVGKAPPQAN